MTYLPREDDTLTNIRDLPEGHTYWTERGYSQSYPWVEVKRTAKTVTIAKVVVKRDPEWKPQFIAGGFSAHCTNQQNQTWLFDNIDWDYTRTLRATKKGWASHGTLYTEGRAIEFYDYNF